MNHATCIYRAQNAPLIELLALTEPTPDGYTIRLSEAERQRYGSLPLLAEAAEIPENTGTSYRIDTSSPAFDRQVLQATEIITAALPALGRLQKIVNLKPVAREIFSPNWAGLFQPDSVIFPHHALQPCLDVLEQTGSPAVIFTAVTSEAHARELHDAGIREFRFQYGNQHYLATSASRWQHTSATAATTLFEHRALITKIAGLLLSMGRSVHPLLRLVGPDQHGSALLPALDSLREALRNAKNTSCWARLRDFNEEIRNVRLSSELASPSCHRYFTDSRRSGKTVVPANLSLPTLPAVGPVKGSFYDFPIAQTENGTMPMPDDENLPRDWYDASDWPGRPINPRLAESPTHKLSVGRPTVKPCINDTAESLTRDTFHSHAYMADASHDDKELVTEQVEEEEWEEDTGVVALPNVPPLPEAIGARAHAGQEIIVPGTFARTDIPGAQGRPVSQEVSGTSMSLSPQPRLTTACPGQAPAESVVFESLRQRQMEHYKSVQFGKSVRLFGTPLIGNRTCVGDNAIIHAEVRLPRFTIVRPDTVLTCCRFSEYQRGLAVLVFSGEPSGDLNRLRFKCGKVSPYVEFGKVHFILANNTIVPGGVRFASGAVVSHFDVGETEMNNSVVKGSLHLMSPILGANVDFGPDVFVEANVKIGNNVVFQGNNRVEAGSVIEEGAVIKKGVVISRTVAPWAYGATEQVLARPEIPPCNASGTLRAPMGNSPGMAQAGAALQGSSHPQNARPIKMLDLTDDDDVVTVLHLPASAPRASAPPTALPNGPGAAGLQYPVLQPPTMDYNPAPSLSGLRASLLQLHQQLPFPMLFTVPVLSLIPAPPFQTAVSPSMRSDLRATMTEHGLVFTAPPPVPFPPLLQQVPGYRHAPAAQAPAVHGNVPGINTDTSPPILYPQPFSPFVMRKPGL